MLESRHSAQVLNYAQGKAQCVNPQGAPPGLFVFPEWINPEQETQLCQFIASKEWASHMSDKRPTQHYGYKYHRNGGLDVHKKIAGDWGLLQSVADRLENEFPGVKIGQTLVNLYFEGTGIGAHCDKETDLVFGLSMVGDINMIWSRTQNTEGRMEKIKYEALIPARSLYIMSNDAALIWTHEIPTRKSVNYPEYNPQSPNYGKLVHRLSKTPEYRRVSITFREIME